MDSNRELIGFLKELEKFKLIERGSKTLRGSQETDAEHTWSVSMLILLLKNKLIEDDFDFNRMLEMSLIHDLAEIYTGDYNPLVDDVKNKAEEERAAKEKIISILPSLSREHMTELLDEYEEQKSKESKSLRALDKVSSFISSLIMYEGLGEKYYTEIQISKDKHFEYMQKFTYDKIFSNLFDILFEEVSQKSLYFESK